MVKYWIENNQIVKSTEQVYLQISWKIDVPVILNFQIPNVKYFLSRKSKWFFTVWCLMI